VKLLCKKSQITLNLDENKVYNDKNKRTRFIKTCAEQASMKSNNKPKASSISLPQMTAPWFLKNMT